MKAFKKYFGNMVGLALLCLAASSHANLTTARGTASPGKLVASANNTVVITWQVGVTPGHAGGATSGAPANVYNSGTGGLLGTVGGTLAQAGSGPFRFSETVNFTAAQVQAWRTAGVNRIVVRRLFVGVTTILGEIALPLEQSGLAASRGVSDELDVRRLQIALDENNNAVKVVSMDEALQARLQIDYAGTGVMQGKWQVAEPGSTEGKPMYRTLSLVRQTLLKAQHSELKGPVLPTHRSGKYLLRFCVTPTEQVDVVAGGDSACPLPGLTVQTAYQVLEQKQDVVELVIDSPRQGAVNNSSKFTWHAVPNAVLYKLDVFEIQGQQDLFVTGMLLPQDQNQTSLSQLMQQKLHTGSLYRWQVSAVNGEGKLLAKSKQVVFTYQPGNN